VNRKCLCVCSVKRNRSECVSAEVSLNICIETHLKLQAEERKTNEMYVFTRLLCKIQFIPEPVTLARDSSILQQMHCLARSRCSSVSIVSGYGLDRAMEVRSPAEAGEFFLWPLRPTQSPVQWVPGILSPGVKRGRAVTLTTHPHLVTRSRMSRSYTSYSPCASIGVLWDCFTCVLFIDVL
jgi:hypothetical protein